MSKKLPDDKEQTFLTFRNDVLVVSSFMISKKMGIKHSNIKTLIERKKIDVFAIRLITARGNKSNGKKRKMGAPIQEFFLSERNALILCSHISKNSEEVTEFKEKLVDEFISQRKILNDLAFAIRTNRQNSDWLAQRASGKVDRREQTDAIKEFIEYAKRQGSQNSEKYYINITKMENTTIFNLDLVTVEHENFRNVISGIGLSALQMADRIVAKTIKDGMAQRMYYKDIFLKARDRIVSFVDSLGKIDVFPDNKTQITYR